MFYVAGTVKSAGALRGLISKKSYHQALFLLPHFTLTPLKRLQVHTAHSSATATAAAAAAAAAADSLLSIV